MAVVQISRIQIRRGKSLSGTGLPQLASGELAWSLDTQELYIGNGSVAEGSPAVGNTKILTERDLTVQGNLLNLIQHIYKSNDPAIQTGPTSNDPISRQTQDRLDDRVTVADFGAVADGTTDDTEALQRAIDQLFLNPTTAASSDTADGTRARVILELAPGIYKTTQTLYIPSYATLIGAGRNKTIIRYEGIAGSAVQFINDDSTIGNPSAIGNTLGNTQPRSIAIRGISFVCTATDHTGLKLDAVRDSTFENIIVAGSWGNTYDPDSKGISLNAVSSIVTCANNIFRNVVVSGFSYGVWAKQDILNNTFEDCRFFDLRHGVYLGEAADGTTVGEQYGPRETSLIACKFEDIKRQGFVVERGSGNSTRDCKFTNVGNNGAGVYFPEYPQIYFDSVGNSSVNDQSDRQDFLISKAFTVDLELNQPITATKGSLVKQNVTNIQGTLKEDYDSATTISVVTQYVTSFTNFNSIVISNIYNPGDLTTIDIVGSSTVSNAFETSTTTAQMIVGAAITFNGTSGGVVAGTTYYIKEIVDTSHFKIVNNYLDAFDVGVSARPLSTSAGLTGFFGSYKPTVTPTSVGSLTMVPYIPEITGEVSYSSYGTKKALVGYMPSWSLVAVFPVPSTINGTPSKSVSYDVRYKYKSTANDFTRTGTLSFTVDVDKSATLHSTQAQLSDDFSIVGLSQDDALKLEFSVIILNQYGEALSGLSDVPSSIALRYKQALVGETLSELSYSFTASH